MATEADPVVIDASVAINLNATDCAARVLTALPFKVVIAQAAAAELREDRRSGRNDASELAALIGAGLVHEVTLGAEGSEAFAGLVIGPARETLDDGEAATIAYAVEHHVQPVIDERKALRICVQRFPDLSPLSTVDLLMHPAVGAALGRDAQADAVFLALQAARMPVPAEWLDAVVGLIGPVRAARCPSLPASIRGR